jgi:hypothetical protein
MGMEQVVTFAGSAVPSWPAVRDLLAGRGFPVQVRMIDGQLAFPDEAPPDAWRELRIGTPQGMITLCRESDRVLVVTWGNADGPLRQAWNALTWALAAAGNGQVVTTNAAVTAEDYHLTAELPPSVREPGLK